MSNPTPVAAVTAAAMQEHFKRYQDGGGNFKKGFRVKLKNMDKENDVRRGITETLESAFDQVPVRACFGASVLSHSLCISLHTAATPIPQKVSSNTWTRSV